MFNKIVRIWHTVKFLKPIQIYSRIWFKFVKHSPDLTSTTPPVVEPTFPWVASAQKTSSILDGGVFSFLGEEGSLAEVNWEGPQREKLWRYNQHYFDYLNSAGGVEEKLAAYGILEFWLRDVSPGAGDGWEPYPTSLRIVNWIKWSLQANDRPEGFDASLAVQTRWLMKRLEYHLLGNHLFANAKALVFSGLYFDGAEAQLWLKKGLSIIDTQLQEQFLVDGGHFELSPMYHAIALEDILDLTNVAACYNQSACVSLHNSAATWQLALPKLYLWLKEMMHPDESLSFFNDTALGISAEWSELVGYYDRMGATLVDRTASGTPELANYSQLNRTYLSKQLSYVHLKESGYITVKAGSIYAILDVAAIGPDYLPGHAHADTLSFELSIDMQRVFVNSGISCYGVSAERLRQRGTAAHNTVVIDGEDSSELWSGFRVARRARVRGLEVLESIQKDPEKKPSTLNITAEHDGYTRLAGKPVHARHWSFSDNKLSVSDIVSGSYGVAKARFHFHPDVKVHRTDELQEFQLEFGSGEFVTLSIRKGLASIEQTSWHPRFGASIPNQCLVLELVDSQSQLDLSVS
jgi:uncharacterized heparinase superfamily protein